jgi:hypothetical protein
MPRMGRQFGEGVMNIRRHLGGALIGLGALVIAQGATAAPFDGDWAGESDSGECNTAYAFRINIAEGRISGAARLDRKTQADRPWAATGSVGADGAVALRIETDDMRIDARSRIVNFRGQVNGDSMVLAQPAACQRKATLKKK